MRVGQVDALRGLAALLVALFYHNFYLGGQAIYTGPLDSLQPFHWLYAWGWTLVDLFFVISGFIFAHVYLTDDGSLKPNVTVRDFAVARFARLYPLHFVTLLICALLVVSSRVWGAADYPESSVPVFLENLFFFQVLHGGFNSASWSLSVEAVCYALFIVLARANLLRRYAPLLILCGVCLCFPDELPNRIGRGLIGFFLGFELWRFREAKVPAPVLAVVALIGVLLPVHMWHFKYHVMLDFTLWPAVLLLALKLRAPMVLRWLGDRSYSIYLVHMPVYYAGRIAMHGKPIPASLQLPAMLLAGAMILLLSDLSYRWFETPARQFLRRAPLGRPIAEPA